MQNADYKTTECSPGIFVYLNYNHQIMPANVKFNYLYRDASNFKQFGNIIFSNPNNVPVTLITDIITRNLIDGEFFDANKWGVPSLFFDTKNQDDHEWHEFENIEVTEEPPYSNSAIEDLLDKILLN